MQENTPRIRKKCSKWNIILSNQIQSVFERIRESIAETPFQRHVIRPFYAIENRLGDKDPEVRLVYCKIGGRPNG